MWSPLRGDMRACHAEKQDQCLVMGCLGEICEEMLEQDTELQSRWVFKRILFVGGFVQIFKKNDIPLCRYLLEYETFVRYNLG